MRKLLAGLLALCASVLVLTAIPSQAGAEDLGWHVGNWCTWHGNHDEYTSHTNWDAYPLGGGGGSGAQCVLNSYETWYPELAPVPQYSRQTWNAYALSGGTAQDGIVSCTAARTRHNTYSWNGTRYQGAFYKTDFGTNEGVYWWRGAGLMQFSSGANVAICPSGYRMSVLDG